MYISEHILDLNNHFCRIFRKIASKENLTAEQVKLLLCIPYDGITMTNLAKTLGIDISTLTRNSQKLSDKKFIIRQNDSYDKRKINIYLTKTGNNISENLEDKLDEYSNQFLEMFTIEEREIMESTLEKLNWTLTCVRDNG